MANIKHDASQLALFYSLIGPFVLAKQYLSVERRGALDGKAGVILGGLIAIFLAVIIAANTLPTALGTLANSTIGNAMKNVDAGTISLYKLIGLFAVIAIALLILKGTGII